MNLNHVCIGKMMKIAYIHTLIVHLCCFILDIYEDSVPFDSPPSYKGLAVKYCYKITVGAGRLQSTTKLVRLPVRILVLEGEMSC